MEYDPQNEHYYFANTATGYTTWDDPRERAPPPIEQQIPTQAQEGWVPPMESAGYGMMPEVGQVSGYNVPNQMPMMGMPNTSDPSMSMPMPMMTDSNMAQSMPPEATMSSEDASKGLNFHSGLNYYQHLGGLNLHSGANYSHNFGGGHHKPQHHGLFGFGGHHKPHHYPPPPRPAHGWGSIAQQMIGGKKGRIVGMMLNQLQK